MRANHPELQNYGWTVPVGTDDSHYVQNARLIGRAGWLGWTACSMKSGGNVPLAAAPVGKKICSVCADKAGVVR